MAPDIPRPPTLRRSCQACARGKRRCDQRWPRCTRCQTRKIDCEYINVPLTVGSDTDSTTATAITTTKSTLSPKLPHKRPRQHYHFTTTHSIPLPLPLEITKGYSQSIITYLVSGMRAYPTTFAQNMKTHFIHPELWPSPSSPPLAIKEVHTLCKLHSTSKSHITPLLQQKSLSLLRTLNHTTNFEDLLATTQALLLAQCMLILSDPDTDPSGLQSYSESTSTMLFNLGQKLWQQAPIQLPGSLSPRRAWLLGESVRRTIIVGFMLRSVYSLKMRNYSVRTPFVDSLPFDVRTGLWDGDWDGDVGVDGSGDAMVSLHQYSGMLEKGMVHGISEFGGLILAACRGRAVQGVVYPSVDGYVGY
ncbi:hypothetical protein AbraIFM66951_011181 [Aspergillus brasiliensis]|uniref:Zn(2)-C6 fungal-type domain-containing protein n=1 Tax=Aspergillus brasiliensis TaxID=319629 RepID=A0A9W5YUP2_9EURO|nr:hypothetical protein AbraCBS73388_011102 [Aspergillus brasiliensis]GKZ47624.1 hypothetical protein AbraIFM66951_011181 [Aspergillus brasiliensis]